MYLLYALVIFYTKSAGSYWSRNMLMRNGLFMAIAQFAEDSRMET